MEKVKDFINTKLHNFLESRAFLIILSAFIVFFWILNLGMVAYAAICIVVILLYLSKASFVCLPQIFLMYMASGREFHYSVLGVVIIGILALPALYLIIKDFIINRKAYWKKVSSNRLVLSICLIFIAMLISMIFSNQYGVSFIDSNGKSNTYTVAEAFGSAGMFLINLLLAIAALVKVDMTAVNRRKLYFGLMLVVYIIGIETICRAGWLYFNYNTINTTSADGFVSQKYDSFLDCIVDKQLSLGWGHQNHTIMLINIGFMFAIYIFMTDNGKNKVFAYITMLFAILLNILVLSDGAFLALILPVIIALVFYIKGKRNWRAERPYLISTLAILVVGIAIFFISGAYKIVIDNIEQFNIGVGTRERLYDLAISEWNNRFITGTGPKTSKYTIGVQWWYVQDSVYNYHNALLQIGSTCGLIGLITFVIYLYYALIKNLNYNMISLPIILVFIYSLVHGMVDTLYFNFRIMPLLSIIYVIGENNDALFKYKDLF